MASNKIPTTNNIGGSNHGVTLKYMGETQAKDSNGIRTTVLTYQGTKSVILSAVNARSIGGYDDSISGYLTDINVKQDSGPFWNATLTYSSTWANQITIHIGKSSTPTTYTCNTIMKSMPLQTKSNYCYIWNHVLIYLDTEGYSPPSYASVSALNSSDYKSITNASSGHLKWVKDANEMPTDPVYEEDNQGNTTPHYWKIAYECTKPGVDYYEFPTYEITESSRSTQPPDWWKLKLPGTIVPPTDTMGITGGQWLCHGGQLRYDGKAFDASCTYQWTPDVWDIDLYDTI